MIVNFCSIGLSTNGFVFVLLVISYERFSLFLGASVIVSR